MNTLVSSRTALRRSTVRAASRLLIGSLLALSACMDVDDGSDLDGEVDDQGAYDDVDGPASSSEEVGTAQQSLLGNDCINADVRVLNSLPYSITVKSVDYYNGSEADWRWEDLTNRTVSPGAMEFWTPNLDGSEDEWIYSFNVNYECHGTHDHSFHVNTPDARCVTGGVYFLEVQ